MRQKVVMVGEDGQRRADIQGLRALAVLMVVAFHAGLPVPGGFVGVDVFFVISGFVITGMLIREARQTGHVRLGAFYLRRFKRLIPALALMIAVTVVLSALLLPPFGAQENVALTAVGAMTLTANFVIEATTGNYFDVAAELNPLLHTWSLSVEEQFYLFFPAVLAASWAAAAVWRARWLPAATVMLLACASFGSVMAGSLGIATPFLPEWLLGFYGPVGRIWEFAAGAMLAVIAARLPKLGPAAATATAVAGLTMVGASLWVISAASTIPGPRLLLPVVGTVFILYAGTASNGASRALGGRGIVWIGDRSYSWYLWHWPLIVFAVLIWPESPVAAALAAVLSLIPAALSYRLVEQPFRLLTLIRGAQTRRLVLSTVVPPLVLSGLLLVAADNGFWTPNVERLRSAITTPHADVVRGCSDWDSTGPRDGACVWNAEAPGRPIYLVGDSKAGHLSEAFIAAAYSLKRPLTIATASACPYLDVYLSLAKERRPDWWTAEGCRTSFERAREWLTSAPPGTVVISVNDPYLMSEGYGIGAKRDHIVSGVDLKRPIYVDQMVRTISDLTEVGHDVVVVQPGPIFPDWDPQACSVLTIASSRCGAETTLEWLDSRNGPLLRATQEAAAIAGAVAVDYRSVLCPDGLCSTTPKEGIFAYRDGGHLSIAGSSLLVDVATNLLAPHA